MKKSVLWLLLCCAVYSQGLYGFESFLPAEQRWSSGSGLALSNSGVASTSDLSAIQVNPANVALYKQYEMSASYLWPAKGREIYRVGVIDGSSSKIAAAITYTGFLEDYRKLPGDIPINRRVAAAFASQVMGFNLGLGADYIESYENNSEDPERGVTFSFGIQKSISPSIHLGASVSHLGNTKFQSTAPRTYRAGASWMRKNIKVNLDYQQRDRTTFETEELSREIKSEIKSEKLATISAVFVYQRYLQLMASYAASVESEDSLDLLGVGIGLKADYFRVSYMTGWNGFSVRANQSQTLQAALMLKL